MIQTIDNKQQSSSSTQFINSFINKNRPPIDLNDHELNDIDKKIDEIVGGI